MEKLINDFKISFTKGDTYALAVKFKKIAEDLRSAYFTVKENPDDEPLIQKSLGAGIDKIDDREYKNEKTYKVQLQSVDTANLEANVQYLYDLQVTIDNVVKTVLSGVFVVHHSVTGVTATTTASLEVAVDDEVETEVLTTPATNGVEYEQDPVAMAKIGDLTELETTAKETVVQAINEVKNAVVQDNRLDNILNGTTAVPKATEADHSTSADSATETESINDVVIAKNSTGGVVFAIPSNDVDYFEGVAKTEDGDTAHYTISDGTHVIESGKVFRFYDATYGSEILVATSYEGRVAFKGRVGGALHKYYGERDNASFHLKICRDANVHAKSAIYDSLGNKIDETYVKNSDINGIGKSLVWSGEYQLRFSDYGVDPEISFDYDNLKGKIFEFEFLITYSPTGGKASATCVYLKYKVERMDEPEFGKTVQCIPEENQWVGVQAVASESIDGVDSYGFAFRIFTNTTSYQIYLTKIHEIE